MNIELLALMIYHKFWLIISTLDAVIDYCYWNITARIDVDAANNCDEGLYSQ